MHLSSDNFGFTKSCFLDPCKQCTAVPCYTMWLFLLLILNLSSFALGWLWWLFVGIVWSLLIVFDRGWSWLIYVDLVSSWFILMVLGCSWLKLIDLGWTLLIMVRKSLGQRFSRDICHLGGRSDMTVTLTNQWTLNFPSKGSLFDFHPPPPHWGDKNKFI